MRERRPRIACDDELTGRRSFIVPRIWPSVLHCFDAAAKLALHIRSFGCSMGIALADAGGHVESSVDAVVGSCVGGQTFLYGFRHLLFVEHKRPFCLGRRLCIDCTALASLKRELSCDL